MVCLLPLVMVMVNHLSFFTKKEQMGSDDTQ